MTSKTKLSEVLPPLLFGTATFTAEYNVDPYALGTSALVAKALDLGIRAFDTSPYYGPAEELLGTAFSAPDVKTKYPRNSYFIVTKVGRIGDEEFDYSAGWVRKSVMRSCERLKTNYLDLVYAHDVEFVSEREVLEAIGELRKLRDEGVIGYVGISGYPVSVLCSLAQKIKDETGEPLDAVMSYMHFTLQNRTLANGLPLLKAAGVDVVPSASILGMGLLRTVGPPVGAQGDWHPAPTELRAAVRDANRAVCATKGLKVEDVALQFALETWLDAGSELGSSGPPLPDATPSNGKLGVTAIGVSKISELEETMRIWRDILHDHDHGTEKEVVAKKKELFGIAEEFRLALGSWYDYEWPSPHEGFVNQRPLGS